MAKGRRPATGHFKAHLAGVALILAIALGSGDAQKTLGIAPAPATPSDLLPSNQAAVRIGQTASLELPPASQAASAPAGALAPGVDYTPADALAPNEDPRMRYHVIPAPGLPVYAPPPPGAPSTDEDFFYQPLCSEPDEPADASEWMHWSNPDTWPGGRVPRAGSNITIDCGQYILFDMPAAKNTTVGVLNVTGHLKFLDHPAVGNVSLAAQFVFVTGKLTIGTPEQHFSQHATITLLPNANRDVIPDYANLGSQVFAVTGGQISWYGMPGGNSTPSWVRLKRTVQAGQNRILVDGNVTDWPVGATIVVASTDFDPEQSEELQVKSVQQSEFMNNTWIVELSRPLNYMHYGEPMPVGVRGVEFPQSGEVILVSRNILITAPRRPPGELYYEGGHLGIFMTQQPQHLYGVEFENLGQQGTLGKYPLHFHLCGSMPESFISHCSVHNSNQRCYVMHGTHNMTLTDNVSWRSSGHCFMLEDGTEHGNTYLRNVGILTVPPVHMLTQPYYGVPTNETDNEPAIFWISSAGNTFKDNVAVGGMSGFLQEIRTNRAVAFNQPNSRDKGFLEAWSGEFLNNTAHSNQFGYQLYRNGFSPAHGATYRGIVAYKNSEAGVSAHGANMVFEDALIADSRIGVDFSQSPNSNQTLRNAIILGHTQNIGNAVNCTAVNGSQACIPVSVSCDQGFSMTKVANNPGSGWRSVPRSFADPNGGQVGINLAANAVEEVTFTNFDNGGCYQGGAVGWLNAQGVHVAVTSRMLDLTFAQTNVNQFWVDPKQAAKTGFWYIAYDEFGTLTGKNDSYLVTANNTALLPPHGCDYHKDWNAYVCEDVCYRTLTLSYNEPGKYEYGKAPLGPGSSVRFVRGVDRAVYTRVVNDAAHATYEPLDVMLDMDTREPVWTRRWRTNLPAGYAYNVTVLNAKGRALNPQPAIEWTYSDLRAGPNCEGLVTLVAPNITAPTADAVIT